MRLQVNDDGCGDGDLAFCNAVQVQVGGDEDWDTFVALTLDREWLGLEALSGLTGTVADVVAAAAGAYGVRVGDTVASVRTWDRAEDAQRTFAWADCAFGDRSSRFQERLEGDVPRYQVRDVAFLFRRGDLSAPVTDPGLAALLHVPEGTRVAAAQVRRAVLDQRTVSSPST